MVESRPVPSRLIEHVDFTWDYTESGTKALTNNRSEQAFSWKIPRLIVNSVKCLL